MHARRVIPAAIALAMILTVTARAESPQHKCRTKKNAVAAKYAACRLKAERTFALKGDTQKFVSAQAKCVTKFTGDMAKETQKAIDAGAPCWNSGASDDFVKGAIDTYSAAIGVALGGGTLASTDRCPASQPCRASLASCQVSAPHLLAATGQSFDFGPQSDGHVRPGVTPSFIDNGDGTITDNNTKLTWEKKSYDATSVHYVNKGFTWSASASGNMDGTIATVFLSALNDTAGGGANCFAGHCDWRIPNVKELLSIVDYGRRLDWYLTNLWPPLVPAEFLEFSECFFGCTNGDYTWTSTTDADDPQTLAFVVHFQTGSTFVRNKRNLQSVRAVRGGS